MSTALTSPPDGTGQAPSSSGPTTGTGNSCQVPDRLRGQDLAALPGSGKVVALTFDGGSNAAGVPSILRTLAARHAPATFFLTGRFVRTYPVKSARIAKLHLVGNHTDTHPYLTRLSRAAVRAELLLAEESIRDVTGEDPRRFFRFPYGASGPRVITVANELCYVPFRWTVDTLGWKGTSSGMSTTSVVSRVIAGAQPGAIILMHVGSHPKDGSTLDADALPTIIRKLRRQGYQLVRLSWALDEAP